MEITKVLKPFIRSGANTFGNIVYFAQSSVSLCLSTQCIFFLSDLVHFPARKPRGVSADISEHATSSRKTSQPSSKTKPAPNISIPLPPESHDSAVKTQQQPSGTATHETPALENKSATKTVSGFYTWHYLQTHSF